MTRGLVEDHVRSGVALERTALPAHLQSWPVEIVYAYRSAAYALCSVKQLPPNLQLRSNPPSTLPGQLIGRLSKALMAAGSVAGAAAGSVVRAGFRYRQGSKDKSGLPPQGQSSASRTPGGTMVKTGSESTYEAGIWRVIRSRGFSSIGGFYDVLAVHIGLLILAARGRITPYRPGDSNGIGHALGR